MSQLGCKIGSEMAAQPAVTYLLVSLPHLQKSIGFLKTFCISATRNIAPRSGIFDTRLGLEVAKAYTSAMILQADLNIGQHSLQLGPRSPQVGLKLAQHEAKLAPSWPQVGLKSGQVEAKMAPKLTSKGFKLEDLLKRLALAPA